MQSIIPPSYSLLVSGLSLANSNVRQQVMQASHGAYYRTAFPSYFPSQKPANIFHCIDALYGRCIAENVFCKLSFCHSPIDICTSARAGVSADRRGGERENRQENDKHRKLFVTYDNVKRG